METKTFAFGGVSRVNGVLTLRVCNGSIKERTAILTRNGHDMIKLIPLPKPMTRDAAIAYLVKNPVAHDADKKGAYASSNAAPNARKPTSGTYAGIPVEVRTDGRRRRQALNAQRKDKAVTFDDLIAANKAAGIAVPTTEKALAAARNKFEQNEKKSAAAIELARLEARIAELKGSPTKQETKKVAAGGTKKGSTTKKSGSTKALPTGPHTTAAGNLTTSGPSASDTRHMATGLE